MTAAPASRPLVPPRRRWRAVLAVLAALVGAFGLVSSPTAPASAASPADGDWLGVVNAYRAQSGLPPVVENGGWSSEALAHSCYMLFNGIAHDEVPGRTGYTPGGDVAGNSGNVAVSSSMDQTARSFVELWMTGPFHAIGLLRPGWRTTGYGQCVNGSTSPWRSGATIDVVRGVDWGVSSPTPITFPGDGATTSLDRFVTESPNPAQMCGYGSAGLPLIALMPNGFSSASATLTGPDGPLTTCVLHAGNTSGVAQSILGGDNAAVIMTPATLAQGTHTATLSTNTGSVTWSFNVDADAELSPTPAPPEPVVLEDTAAASDEPGRFDPSEPTRVADSRIGVGLERLRAGEAVRFRVTNDPDVVAVSANFTIARASEPGFLTVYDCGDVPDTATVNYVSTAVQNLGVVPVRDGDVCLYSSAHADVVIDVTGVLRSGPAQSGAASLAPIGDGLVPIAPTRIVDTRTDAPGRLSGGATVRVRIAGVGPVDENATAAVLTVTSIGTASQSFITAWDCSTSSPPTAATGNVAAGETRANAAIVELSAAGEVCVYTQASADLVIDVNGFFVTDGGLDLTPLEPIRLLDSRSSDEALSAGLTGSRLARGSIVRLELAGARGIPADAKAVTLNLATIRPTDPVFVTAYPCGGSVPSVSSLNHTLLSIPFVANAATVDLADDGSVCLYASERTHLTVDITGAWS